MSDLLVQIADLAGRPDSTFCTVLNAVPQGILIFDADRRVIFANSAATSVLRSDDQPQGTCDSPGEIFEGVNFEFVTPETGSVLSFDERPLSRVLGGESIDSQEYLIRRPQSAERRWVEISAQPVRDDGGAITAAVFTFRGIGERKKREFAFEAADKLNNVIYQENLAGIVRVTVDGRILDCNDSIVRMLGYKSKQQMMGMRAPNFYCDPADRERVLRLLWATRRVSKLEICLRRADGSRCWALLNARLLDPPPGEVGGTILATFVDITERKLQEETLRQSQQRFTAFMHHLPGIAFIKDLAGRYVYYNEAAWTVFGMRPEDIVGKTDEEIWPAEDAARYRQNDAAVIETGRPSEYLEPFTRPDGPRSWLIYKFPITENGKVSLVGGIGIDITERTLLLEQLTQARKMEALGRLAGGVAHDFNNLLTVIAGYSQLAIESLGTVPSDRMISYLREILDSSRRASGLTGQLLAFSRRQVVQLKVLNLADLVRSMDRLLQRVIGEHVELAVKCSSEDCFVHADPNQMEQAIMNLAVNARDAMPLGGQLLLRCERIAQPLAQEGAEPLSVLLEVRDNGVGMDEAVRSRIFDPFYTSKETGKGTGLGLSTVYSVVSQAKGRIDVESTPGEGTTFKLYFPLVAPLEPESTVSPRPPSAPQGKETVLLVEDEASVRALAETILKRLGYNVLVADSGPAAIALWKERSGAVDVLLTDVIMPQMSGGELAHKLREMAPHLRVLFMSGYTDDMIASHGVLAGETQLIQKPFTAEALGRKLRAVLDA